MAADDPANPGMNGYFERAWRFNFFQAVKLLESVVREQRRASGKTEVIPPGAGDDPEEEPVRFRSRVSLAFPPSDLYEIEMRPRDGGTPVMTVDFMGLAGSRGPLPDYWVETVRDRERRGDGAMRAFLDIFNHRLVSLFYRVRQRHRPTLHTGPIESHPFSKYLLAFCGLGTPAARNVFEEAATAGGLELQARDLVLYAGLLWSRDRSLAGLERVLGHALRVKVEGRTLRGRWLRIPDDERTRLSAGPANNRLGVSAVAGNRIWDPQAGFELRLGPMKWDEFSAYLPTGRRFGALGKLVRFYVRSAFDFHAVLVLDAAEVAIHRPALGATDGPRLGWTSWALTRPLTPKRETVEIRVAARPLPEVEPG